MHSKTDYIKSGAHGACMMKVFLYFFVVCGVMIVSTVFHNIWTAVLSGMYLVFLVFGGLHEKSKAHVVSVALIAISAVLFYLSGVI